MHLKTLLFGIYPRTENLRREYAKWERGQMNGQELAVIISDEKEKFYELARYAGLDYFTDPLFNWYDILRPIALSVEGIKLGPLRRYKETNTFYREPYVKYVGDIFDLSEYREIESNPPLPAFHSSPGQSYLYFLPGIHSFLRMSHLDCSYQEALDGLEKAYLKLIDTLSIKRLLIYEPIGIESLEIYSSLASATMLFIAVQDFKGNLGTGSWEVHSVISNDPYKFSRLCEVPGIMGIDAFSTKIGNGAVELAKKFADDFTSLIVANNESFDFLPRVIADKKLMSFRGESFT
ncbi:MAG: hypothetical protein QW834_01735 [Thermoplasmatales archaeon]